MGLWVAVSLVWLFLEGVLLLLLLGALIAGSLLG
jgi:hypothetical protein